MAIFKPLSSAPSVGTPVTAVAPQQRKRKLNMLQPGFYQQSMQPRQPVQESITFDQREPLPAPVDPEQPTTEDRFKEQFARYQDIGAPPSLQPGARVKSPDSSLVQPDQFRMFYEQLNTIGNIGQRQLGAERARQQFRQMERLQEIMAQGPPGFNAPTLRGQGGGGGGGAYGSIPNNPKANFRYAQNIAPRYGWGAKEQAAWYTLGMKESGWNANAQNPTSTAYGIGQFLDSTWGNYGLKKSSDPAYQVNAMAKYIKARYGSPSRALAFHLRNNWY